MFCVFDWQDLRALQLIFAVQPPKQLPPLLLDCLRCFLHIGQTLQESRRQQQRQAAVILEQQAAAAASASSSSSSSAEQRAHEEKPAVEKPKAFAPPEPESTSASGQSPDVVKDPSKTGDEGTEASTSSHVAAADGDEPSQPASDENMDASKPQTTETTDDVSECTSSTADDRDGKTRTEEGKGNGENVFEWSLV